MYLKTTFLYIVILFFVNLSSFAQKNKIENKTDQSIDITAARLYFQIADTLMTDKQPSADLWNSFFNTQINKLLISGQRLDSSIFKREMSRVYNPSNSFTAAKNETELYHLEYKRLLPELKQHLANLQSMSITQKVKNYLYPYLPTAFRNAAFLPKQYYIFYGSEDATGLNGIVINDLLLSYKLDRYLPGVLSAHEAYHAINNKEFNHKISKSINWADTRAQVFMFINLLAEEGIADQIDKKHIFNSESPVKTNWEDINDNYENNSKVLIKRMDSLFTKLQRDSMLTIPQNDFFSLYGKFGGHWPGRFMGETITKNGMTKELFSNFKDPFHFMLIYNAAAKKDPSKPPCFSEDALKYLRDVRKYCLYCK